jgi:hypothetical protein
MPFALKVPPDTSQARPKHNSTHAIRNLSADDALCRCMRGLLLLECRLMAGSAIRRTPKRWHLCRVALYGYLPFEVVLGGVDICESCKAGVYFSGTCREHRSALPTSQAGLCGYVKYATARLAQLVRAAPQTSVARLLWVRASLSNIECIEC